MLGAAEGVDQVQLHLEAAAVGAYVELAVPEHLLEGCDAAVEPVTDRSDVEVVDRDLTASPMPRPSAPRTAGRRTESPGP